MCVGIRTCRIVLYYEKMAVRLAEEQGFLEPLLVETDDLVFLGETVSAFYIRMYMYVLMTQHIRICTTVYSDGHI